MSINFHTAIIAASRRRVVAPPPSGDAYLDLWENDSTENYVDMPSADFVPADELDLTIDTELFDWGSLGSLMEKWGSTNPTRAYEFYHQSNLLRLTLRSTAGINTTYDSSTTFDLSGRNTVRVTTAIENGERVVRFYVNGVQLGTDITGTDTANIQGANRPNGISNRRATNGRVYRAEYRTAVGGSLVRVMDPNDWVSGSTWVSSTGETWTLRGTATIAT